MRSLEKVSSLGCLLREPSSLPLPTAPADQLDGLDQPAGYARYQVSARDGAPWSPNSCELTEAASPTLHNEWERGEYRCVCVYVCVLTRTQKANQWTGAHTPADSLLSARLRGQASLS